MLMMSSLASHPIPQSQPSFISSATVGVAEFNFIAQDFQRRKKLVILGPKLIDQTIPIGLRVQNVGHVTAISFLYSQFFGKSFKQSIQDGDHPFTSFLVKSFFKKVSKIAKQDVLKSDEVLQLFTAHAQRFFTDHAGSPFLPRRQDKSKEMKIESPSSPVHEKTRKLNRATSVSSPKVMHISVSGSFGAVKNF